MYNLSSTLPFYFSVSDISRPRMAAKGSAVLIENRSVATKDEVGSNVLGIKVMSRLASVFTVNAREDQLELDFGAEVRRSRTKRRSKSPSDTTG